MAQRPLVVLELWNPWGMRRRIELGADGRVTFTGTAGSATTAMPHGEVARIRRRLRLARWLPYRPRRGHAIDGGSWRLEYPGGVAEGMNLAAPPRALAPVFDRLYGLSEQLDCRASPT